MDTVPSITSSGSHHFSPGLELPSSSARPQSLSQQICSFFFLFSFLFFFCFQFDHVPLVTSSLLKTNFVKGQSQTFHKTANTFYSLSPAHLPRRVLQHSLYTSTQESNHTLHTASFLASLSFFPFLCQTDLILSRDESVTCGENNNWSHDFLIPSLRFKLTGIIHLMYSAHFDKAILGLFDS